MQMEKERINIGDRYPWFWPFILWLSALSIGVVTIGDLDFPLRPLLAFWFLLVCPGMAFVRLLRIKEGFAVWTLAIALSLALDAIVAGAMLYAGFWSPTTGLLILVGITLVGVGIQFTLAYGVEADVLAGLSLAAMGYHASIAFGPVFSALLAGGNPL
jgi:hypothetical protein